MVNLICLFSLSKLFSYTNFANIKNFFSILIFRPISFLTKILKIFLLYLFEISIIFLLRRWNILSRIPTKHLFYMKRLFTTRRTINYDFINIFKQIIYLIKRNKRSCAYTFSLNLFLQYSNFRIQNSPIVKLFFSVKFNFPKSKY